ncbi:MAG: DegT/DnrJ/EryC1/StrS aminotransferase family protein [Candidatus Omnitrophota bacterium]
MVKKIEHSFSCVGREEREALDLVIRRNFLAQGSETVNFELDMAKYIGCRYAMATCTGTTALHLALLACGINKGDEVIIPNYVCRAVLNTVQYCQAQPVLCDVDKRTFNILEEDIKLKISRRTGAIIITHMFGCPTPINKFKKFDIPIIEDCAQSIGAEYKGKRVGSGGDISIFSFEGTKTITTGEGGMVLTNSARLYERLLQLKEPHKKSHTPKYTYRMSDLQAAVGRVQLKKLPGFIRKRERIARQYMRELCCADIGLPFVPKHTKHAFYRFMITLKQGNLENFLKNCQKKGVLVKRPISLPTLNQYLGISNKRFPNTDYIINHCVSVPIYPALLNKNMQKVIKVIKDELK